MSYMLLFVCLFFMLVSAQQDQASGHKTSKRNQNRKASSSSSSAASSAAEYAKFDPPFPDYGVQTPPHVRSLTGYQQDSNQCHLNIECNSNTLSITILAHI